MPNEHIALTPEDQATLQRLQHNIQVHQDSLAALQLLMVTTLREHYDVNLTTEQWTLDLTRGLLTHDRPSD
jgi:hypothetical protein